MQIDEKQAWQEELKNREKIREIVPVLQKMPVVEVGEILSELENEDLIEVLPLFTYDQQGMIFSEFDMPRKLDFFRHISKKRFGRVFENMHSDSRADMFQEMEQEEQVALLPFLNKQVREDVLRLSAYPPETAGGIMNTDFATVEEHKTCGQAIDKVRKDAPNKMIYYIYAVDSDMILQGFLTLKDLILADPNEKVSSIMFREYAFATVDEDRESVASKIERYDLVAIPVVNQQNQLVGIVHHDDAMEVIHAEHTEDMEKFMGIVPGREILDYNQTGVFTHFRKRVIWLSSLAILGLISGIIIHAYEEALSALIILALYMPMVADTGGNTGSQAATVVIRALALGQVSVKDWFRILFKEARIAILLSLVLGAIAFGKILFLSWETEVPQQFNLLYVATGISAALSLQVITATVLGASLPLFVKRLGGDPAVAASPAITTVVDITGLLIYFGIATIMFF